MSLVYLLLAIPLVAGLATLALPSKRSVDALNAIAATAVLVTGLVLAVQVFTGGPLQSPGAFFYVDALSAFEIGIAVVVAGAAQCYAFGHMGAELAQERFGFAKYQRFHALLDGFLLVYLLVCVANNLGVVWIAIEGTTLVTAFLVAFYNRNTSIEAAWKYFVLCTVGITLALMGVVLLYYSASHLKTGAHAAGLEWSQLAQVAQHMNPDILKLSFVFTLIGYGTKVGLAPLHTWKPDAYAEAPSPVSALLAGLLANGALYGVIRSHALVVRAVGEGFSNNLLLIFGLASLVVAVPFVLYQKDFKRLLAYSSVEHMGIIALGLGFGGALGTFGALLHTLFHSLVKASLFFATGNMLQKYGTREIAGARGVLAALPVTGPAAMLGAFAIAGAPPFGLFLTEVTILTAGFQSGRWGAALVMLGAITLVFMGFVKHFSRMGFGEAPPGVAVGELGRWTVAPMVAFLALAGAIGVYVPAALVDAIHQAVTIVRGAS